MIHDHADYALAALISGGLLALLLLICLPIIIAFRRGHPNRWLILILCLVFGATLLGWLVALFWSLHGFHRGRDGIARGGASGLNLFAEDVKQIEIVGLGAWQAAAEPSPVYTGPAPSAPKLRSIAPLDTRPHRHRSIAEAARQIERLARLRAAGHLSESEYASLKAGVLGTRRR